MDCWDFSWDLFYLIPSEVTWSTVTSSLQTTSSLGTIDNLEGTAHVQRNPDRLGGLGNTTPSTLNQGECKPAFGKGQPFATTPGNDRLGSGSAGKDPGDSKDNTSHPDVFPAGEGGQ